jgi:hypothetical protein
MKPPDKVNQPTNLWGAEQCSRGHQLCSHSVVSLNFMEPEDSLPRSLELSTSPVHTIPTYVFKINLNVIYPLTSGARGSVVVKALCYKPEGRGFETR